MAWTALPVAPFKRKPRSLFRPLSCALVTLFAAGFLAFWAEQASAQWPRIAFSKDGTPISFEVSGQGEPTLVFVHGWSCDSRYFREQVPEFSKRNRVVVLDLAGHGHSGLSRSEYTMESFGEDVRAVADAVGSNRMILIGHSMGGSVIAESARLMPERVLGLIGVDTLENIEYPMTQTALDQMTQPLEKDFGTGCRDFVKTMIYPDSPALIRDWIMADMSSAPPQAALSAMKAMLTQYITGRAARVFDGMKIPVVTVNGDLWPVDSAANRRHMVSFDAVVIKGADHFLMMTKPSEFNRELAKAIVRLSGGK